MKEQFRVKYYADTPDGIKNKLFSYPTYDLSHSIDILNKATSKGFKIRMAWHNDQQGNSKSLKPILNQIDGNINATYSAVKELDRKLDSKFNATKSTDFL